MRLLKRDKLHRNTNPLRYSSLLLLNEPHGACIRARNALALLIEAPVRTDIGEVWANMLHNVYAQLVAARGFSSTAKTDPT